MVGWVCTARPETCAHCGRSAVLLARTRRCDPCETDAYDATMMREFPWFVPHGPTLRVLAAAREGVEASC
jgi:hypothetical protein